MQGAKSSAKAEDLAEEAKDIEEYAVGLGKKVEIIIHGDEDIKGGIQLFELLKD
ncbi:MULTISPECIES: hypothetical protein [unclassified Chryseobacterium]|uniref:hypothetical protein n=1 Tax=unclassified Chryseobacterium TaxID=2593645 RepID=UPI0013FDE816|nr:MULTISPECIES: hypothetical protein [unclassified Chryseobacterium]